MKKIGFIGAGNMGYPEIKGAVTLLGASEVAFYTKTAAHGERVAAELGATFVPEAGALVADCEYVVLVVKPQVIPSLYGEIAANLHQASKLISSMAGIAAKTICEQMPFAVPVFRIMPNTPAMVGEGMTTMSVYGAAEDGEEAAFVKALCESFGKCLIIPEHLMSAATCAAGSSPAYVYLFMEALADSVVKYGIPRKQAYELVAQTVLGAGKMLLATGEHPGALKDAVCSPGGTTICGVAALEEAGLRHALFAATDACFEKSERLAGK